MSNKYIIGLLETGSCIDCAYMSESPLKCECNDCEYKDATGINMRMKKG